MLTDRDSLKEVGLYEFLAHLLDTADVDAIAQLIASDENADAIIAALTAIATGTSWHYLRTSAVAFIGRCGQQERWRERALVALRSLAATTDGDVRMSSERFIVQLTGSAG